MRSSSDYREEPCKSALNRVKGMRFFGWSLNPYMGCVHRCTFCYVRAFERRADRPWDDRYGTSIRVKVNMPEVLRAELARRSWKRENVAIGAATDPYQPAEGSYRLTRRCIEALADARTPLSIITRSPMVIRDIDVLQHAASRAEVRVTLSIPTLDDRVWRTTEPGTAPPRQRLRAIRRLTDAGISASVAMAPLLPGLSDDREAIETVVRAAREAGATSLWAKVLHMGPGTKEHFMAALARDWPEQVPAYQALYAGRAYLDDRTTAPTIERVEALRELYEIADRRELRIERDP
ncbi:MAG: radical SAM protein, partial [Dehalococcoidia bacterium]